MSLRFQSVTDPSDTVIERLSRLTPQTPFNSRAYIAAVRTRGLQPCMLGLTDDAGLLGGAIALISPSPRKRQLTIATAPSLPEPQLYWQGVAEFCRKQGISELHVETFASTVRIEAASGRDSALPAPSDRRRRFEYVLELRASDPAETASKHHRRNARRARRAGVVLTRCCSAAGATAHLQTMRASMRRRRERGESVAAPDDDSFYRALLQEGAAELFQATHRASVWASILVLRGARSAYYQSAGTTSEGMLHGASPYLVIETAKTLADEGFLSFNLGGADPSAVGLRRFKSDFGAQALELESLSYSMISRYDRAFRRLADAVEDAPGRLWHAIVSASR